MKAPKIVRHGGPSKETTLHRQLKTRYGSDLGGQVEVVSGPYRADAVGTDGEWIEVQSGALGPLRGKLQRLLPERRIRVVKPVVVERRIIKRNRREGKDISSRLSPRRGAIIDVFDDFIGLAKVFPHPNLRIDIIAVAIDEVRVIRKRWPGFVIVDRSLREIRETTQLVSSQDLWSLLPDELPNPFTTLNLAEVLDRPVEFAQRIAYCLRHSGAAESKGKIRNRVVYERAERSVVELALTSF